MTKLSAFARAFAAARAKGLKAFPWNGKSYSTKTKGEGSTSKPKAKSSSTGVAATKAPSTSADTKSAAPAKKSAGFSQSPRIYGNTYDSYQSGKPEVHVHVHAPAAVQADAPKTAKAASSVAKPKPKPKADPRSHADTPAQKKAVAAEAKKPTPMNTAAQDAIDRAGASQKAEPKDTTPSSFKSPPRGEAHVDRREDYPRPAIKVLGFVKEKSKIGQAKARSINEPYETPKYPTPGTSPRSAKVTQAPALDTGRTKDDIVRVDSGVARQGSRLDKAIQAKNLDAANSASNAAQRGHTPQPVQTASSDGPKKQDDVAPKKEAPKEVAKADDKPTAPKTLDGVLKRLDDYVSSKTGEPKARESDIPKDRKQKDDVIEKPAPKEPDAPTGDRGSDHMSELADANADKPDPVGEAHARIDELTKRLDDMAKERDAAVNAPTLAKTSRLPAEPKDTTATASVSQASPKTSRLPAKDDATASKTSRLPAMERLALSKTSRLAKK
jgi:hypothetical protein